MDHLQIVSRVAQLRFDDVAWASRAVLAAVGATPPPAPMQYFDAELVLQLLNALADRGLR